MAVQVGRTNAQSQGGSRHYRTEQAAVAVAGSGTTGTTPPPANEAYTIPQQKAIAPQPKQCRQRLLSRWGKGAGAETR